MTDTIPTLEQPVAAKRNPFNMALVIDNKVYQIMNVDGQTAAAFLEPHTFVQIADGEAQAGWDYDPVAGTFTEPVEETPEA
jgi:hypothetical protein